MAAQLFPDHRPRPPRRTTWRVTIAGGAVVARSPNLAFALAQVRALATAGTRCWLRDSAGACVAVTPGPHGVRLVPTSLPEPSWLGTARAVLADHP